MTNKKLIRIGLILMVLAVVGMAMVGAASADTQSWDCGASETETPSNNVIATLYDNGLMEFTGSGDMFDWNNQFPETRTPWYNKIN